MAKPKLQVVPTEIQPEKGVYVPSPQQQAYFDWVNEGRGSAFLEAVAGAGKTTTLVRGCQAIIAANPRVSVAAAMYNKKNAVDFQSKLGDMEISPKSVRAGTFHSFGFSAWRFVHKDVKVDDKIKWDRIVNETALPRHLEGFARGLVSLAKQAGIGAIVDASNMQHWWDIVEHHDLDLELENPEDVKEGIRASYKALKRSRDIAHEIIDFDDMIYMPIATNCRVWQNDWVVVDEAQDTNPARRALAKKMLKPGGRAVFVGDRFQSIYGFCHPAGTMVKTPEGHRPIEELRAGDPVITSLTDGDLFGWKGGYPVQQTHKFSHKGRLLTVHAGDRKVEFTPHHKMPVRVDLGATHYTYIMRRQGVYRLGHCQAFAKGDFMLTHRVFMEKADAAWILESYQSKEAAVAAEDYLLAHMNGQSFQNLTDELVQRLPTCEGQALRLLSQFGRMVDFPLISLNNKKRFAKNGPFITEACNLMEGMRVAFYSQDQEAGGSHGKRQTFKWTPIEITSREFEGEVYGITVTPPPERIGYQSWPLYFAGDDILVHNTGADNDSIDIIIREFGCSELPLTITYRCPKAVVRKAQEVVKHITAHESAPEGVVRDIDLGELQSQNLRSTDAILCRNTAPLVSLAYTLIKARTACHVEGKSIGEGLKKLISRWKTNNIAVFRDAVVNYREKRVAKLMKDGKEAMADKVNDQVDTVLAIADGCSDVEALRAKIDTLFQDDTPTLTLSTVHKAKGREWDRVFVLGANLYMPSKYARQDWQLQQEDNLVYVAYTRSKAELVSIRVAA